MDISTLLVTSRWPHKVGWEKKKKKKKQKITGAVQPSKPENLSDL